MVTGSRLPAFRHADMGTPEQVWADSSMLDSAAPLQLEEVSDVVVVAAHPDDESLGAGGLLAAADRAGLGVTVLIATLGERSHPLSTTHGPDDLRSLRRTEVCQAVAQVAPTASVRVLGLPDGDLGNHLAPLRTAIEAAITGPGTLVVAPWRGDGHPDHQAAGDAAAAAATGVRLLEYPIWAWHWARPGQLPPTLRVLHLDEELRSAKGRAVSSHRSQTEPLSDRPGDEPIVSPPFAAHFQRPFEIFVESTGAGPHPASLPKAYFDAFYGNEIDPWGFQSRWYEERKRGLTVAALPRQRFSNAFEPGCSIGVMTAALAPRCDRLLSTDISERPLRAARERLAASETVSFAQLQVPRQWPPGTFDLIVLSEMAYYCTATDLDLLVRRVLASLTADGVLLACHWRHPVDDYPLTGDQVHAVLRRERGLALLADHTEEDFLLQVYTRPPAISVARATGLLS